MNWTDLVVSPCATHHLVNNEPAYLARFDEVLKFHSPGLAPVRRDTFAWHVHPDGTQAYARRFQRTFGFYEGLAAVLSDEGALHITAAGEDAYPQRYEWCGNYQEGHCTVRDTDGAYFHITPDGRPAYRERWRYAGDFRDGVAVVQAADGRSTHINAQGLKLHGIWFHDLDVFHKGFARAKDARGWMHIDMRGHPIYERRFAAVEPFYNGQARVETVCGGLEVIDESGVILTVLRTETQSEFASLSGDMVGFWRTETIAAAVELGVFEVLPTTAASMAEKLAVQHDRLARLLRALSELNLVKQVSEVWHVTERGSYLRKDHPLTLSHAALEFGRHFPGMWSQLAAALRRDGGWTPPDIFGMLAADTTRSALHHQMLRSYARHDYPTVSSALNLVGNECVIDAGGGLGVLADVLLSQQPTLQLVVLDRPEVVALARATHTRRDQIQWVARDFFAPWDVSGDAVVLARILHDWDDPDALRILARARESMPLGGQMFIVEMVMSDNDPSGALCDLHLLMVTGGRERTLAQYTELLARTGFALKEAKRMNALSTVLIGEAI
ncbi:methyltransferase [Aquabacterium sp.]|uniref:methyltransferase n=1 Tax=Aquabacterium sp. TaxID=1872578 RepID=UPI0035B2308E